MSENEQYFILLLKKLGKKKERGFVSSLKSGSKVELLAGTLLVLTDNFSKGDKLIFLLETLDSETVEIQCIPGEIETVGLGALDLLNPVPTCQDRLAVYQDKEWMKEGLVLKEGDHVLVKPKGEQTELPGILRYKGKVPNIKGIIFGVELTENQGSGTSDGQFRRERYFTCPPDSAVFCPIHRIHKQTMGGSRVPRRADKDLYATASHIPSQDYPNCGLRLGDRVVWMSDRGPECGTVKWIGVLPEDRNAELTVGVEFDNPVGSGTGKYKEHRLFYARQNHASLVPILGLLKEEEFFSPGFTQGDYRDEHINVVHLDHQHTGSSGHKLLDYNTDNEQDISLSKRDFSEVLKHGKKTTEEFKDNVQGNNLDFGMAEKVRDMKVYGLSGDPVSRKNPLYNSKENVGEINQYDKHHDTSVGNSSQSSGKVAPTPDPDLGVDSMVEVLGNPPLYGVIRWVGALPDNPWKQIAGLEMEDETSAGTDGTFKGHRLFHCGPKRALFVPLYKCHKDKRFHAANRRSTDSTSFGILETPDISGDVSPPSSLETVRKLIGKNKGIQGHHNSCYLDATLFAMFSFTTVFDSVLYRPPTPGDLEAYADVQKVLKEGIVNPLRKLHYVRADKVMALRKFLDKLGKIPGMMGEEKDPEEFLSTLLGQIMRADPLLHLSSGEKTNFYQLFMEKDDMLLLPTTQKLVELSFHQSNVKLKEVPSCFIIQMPRFGKDYKMFRRIIPSLELDITDILEEGARECIVCGNLATHECKDCYQLQKTMLSATAFCQNCCSKSHQHKTRKGHLPTPIKVSEGLQKHLSSCTDVDLSSHREKMELFAVVCIQTSHYVSFVKCGTGDEAQWVFFDSMADRMGEQKGYNIPEVKVVPELSGWLSEGNWDKIHKIDDDKQLPESIRRLLCDAYMCMYQSSEVAMFK
ncbi:ubiquitin carboxyl-terminal hydrolase CYLD-like [Haliotis cracherodii]|uniref:ubiquitin carboxyl-terminal hydrolase CYLD-like n=1 Tax=Haliotis cracherodii TaxID=6455 RepID=UPI0039EC1252